MFMMQPHNSASHYDLGIMTRATLLLLFFISSASWSFSLFGERLCKEQGYSCIKIKRGDSWAQLFPSARERDLVQRINRMNVFLQPEMEIAIPANMSNPSDDDFSPLPQVLPSDGEKKILVSLSQFAFGAYDENGRLIRWGPVSPGAKICLETSTGCSTPAGTFRITHKSDGDCISKTLPVRMNGVKGGGDMPFCMFFYRGYALHGSSELPGYAASSGCVRLFIDDAKWLNEHFVDLPSRQNKGTRVIVSQ